MSQYLYHYKALIWYVYDGDGVFRGTVDFGMKLKQDKEMRLYGVDCPELRTGTKKERLAGKKVREYIAELILDKEVLIKTFKDESGK